MYPEEIAAEVVLALARTILILVAMFFMLRLSLRQKRLVLWPLVFFFIFVFLLDTTYQTISDFFYPLFAGR